MKTYSKIAVSLVLQVTQFAALQGVDVKMVLADLLGFSKPSV